MKVYEFKSTCEVRKPYQTSPYRKFGASDLWIPLHTSYSTSATVMCVKAYIYLDRTPFSHTNWIIQVRVVTPLLRIHLH